MKKAGEKTYHMGNVKFELQRYDFTRDGWWGNIIELTDPENGMLQAGPGHPESWKNKCAMAANQPWCRVFGLEPGGKEPEPLWWLEDAKDWYDDEIGDPLADFFGEGGWVDDEVAAPLADFWHDNVSAPLAPTGKSLTGFFSDFNAISSVMSGEAVEEAAGEALDAVGGFFGIGGFQNEKEGFIGDEDGKQNSLGFLPTEWFPGQSDTPTILPKLDAHNTYFRRKWSRKPTTDKNKDQCATEAGRTAKPSECWYNAYQMETGTTHAVTGTLEGINETAIATLQSICTDLAAGKGSASGGGASFNVYYSQPSTGEAFLGNNTVRKTCPKTGGDFIAGTDGREEEKKIAERITGKFSGIPGPNFPIDYFGRADSDGNADTGAAGGTVDEGYGTLWSSTVRWGQTVQENKNKYLYDKPLTDVCEPGWEWNLGPLQPSKSTSFKRGNKHTCIFKNMTLYSSLAFCFGLDTPIFLMSGNIVSIQDVKLGDILADGSVVTNTIISEVGENTVYTMPTSCDKPIIVSNQHKVELIARGQSFVRAEDHPDAIKLETYTHEYLYCISTNTKRIIINDYVFQDWDEIGALDYGALFKYFNEHPNFIKEIGLYNKVQIYDMIHTKLASGLWGKTPIRLFNKSVYNLDELQVGDLLTSGERILSVIRTDCTNVDIYKHKIQNKTFYGSKNIAYYATKKSSNPIEQLESDQPIKCDDLPDKSGILYHFVTNSGSIAINGVNIAYHNHSLQHLLPGLY